MVITSSANPSVKRIRSLRLRKERDATALFFVEGIRIVGEAVELGAEIESVVVAPEILESTYARELVEALEERDVPVLEVTGEVFKSMSLKDGPQGIGAVVRQHWERLDDVQPGPELCWVALADVSDPGNLGTILRTSDAVGAAGVILIGSSTDPYDPAALRASMGAIFSQQLVRAWLPEFSDWRHRTDWHVVGTSDAAELDYRDGIYRSPLVLMMGSERHGLSREQQTLCDFTVSIPMVGRSDSLNLSIATGVVLYEIFDQRYPRVTT